MEKEKIGMETGITLENRLTLCFGFDFIRELLKVSGQAIISLSLCLILRVRLQMGSQAGGDTEAMNMG